jgi:hypothetical protein
VQAMMPLSQLYRDDHDTRISPALSRRRRKVLSGMHPLLNLGSPLRI